MIKPFSIAASKKASFDFSHERYLRVRFSSGPFQLKFNGDILVMDMGEEIELPPNESFGKLEITNLSATYLLALELVVSRYPIRAPFVAPRLVNVGGLEHSIDNTARDLYHGITTDGKRRYQVILTNTHATKSLFAGAIDNNVPQYMAKVDAGKAITYQGDALFVVHNDSGTNAVTYILGQTFYVPTQLLIP